MRKITMGLFRDRMDAEEAISKIQSDLDVDSERISYIYKNSDDVIKEADADEINTDTASGARKGAAVGGTIGALAGIAAVAGIIPVVGPLVVAGPIAAALGIGGAAGTAAATAAAGAATGAAAGGIIGALSDMGVGKERAEYYSDRVNAGDILVSVETEADMEKNVAEILEDSGAAEVSSFAVAS